MLSRASLRINQSLDFDTVLQGALDSARALTGARYGVMTLLEGAGRVGDFPAASWGYPALHRSFYRSDGRGRSACDAKCLLTAYISFVVLIALYLLHFRGLSGRRMSAPAACGERGASAPTNVLGAALFEDPGGIPVLTLPRPHSVTVMSCETEAFTAPLSTRRAVTVPPGPPHPFTRVGRGLGPALRAELGWRHADIAADVYAYATAHGRPHTKANGYSYAAADGYSDTDTNSAIRQGAKHRQTDPRGNQRPAAPLRAAAPRLECDHCRHRARTQRRDGGQ